MDSPISTTNILVPIFFFLIISSLIGIVIYRLYLDPLCHIPGPPLWRISRLPFAYNLVLGRLPYTISTIHERYGPVVRLAPDEVSFITEYAWNDIYLVQRGKDGKKVQMQKDPLLFLRPEEGSQDMLFEYDDLKHARQRRIFSHAFSDKMLREQEPVILQHVGKFMTRLQDVCGGPIDMSAWFNYLLFDTIGDLVVGETFDCLEKKALHPWASTFFSFAKGITIMDMTQRFWPLTPIIMLFVPKEMQEAEAELRRVTKEKVETRLAVKSPKKDIVSTMASFLEAPGAGRLTRVELYHNTQIFVVGGSETTATTLSGLLFFLLSNRRTLKILTNEIRSTFSNIGDIKLDTVRSLKYQNAVISETFRMFSPVAGSLRRITPPEGCEISGVYIPGNTTVAVDSYAASHAESSFHSAERFIPERWLHPSDPSTRVPDGYSAKDFANDKRSIVQPFCLGPRNCIGKNIGLATLNLVVARLVWEFDFVLMEESRRWVDGMEVYVWYKRPPLMCKLIPVERV